jgi:hypothetical protein
MAAGTVYGADERQAAARRRRLARLLISVPRRRAYTTCDETGAALG